MLDDLERALAAAEEHEEAKLEEGVRLVHRALADALAREGLAEIETDGAFDPHVHEALLSQPSDGRGGLRARGRCRRATASATACCGRPAWSWPRRRRTMAAVKDLYETLGVAKGASARTRSRRRTASSRASTTRTRTRATTSAEERFKEVQGAYDVLSDPEKRKQYDRFGSSNGRGPRPGRRQLRGLRLRRPRRPGRHLRRPLRRPRRGAQQQPRGQRGSDLEVEVRLSFEDSLQGRRDDDPGRARDRLPRVQRLGREARHGAGALPRVPRPRRRSPRARACSRSRSRARAAAATAP